ncbi:MAG: hypothetical protein ACLFPJ_06110 [Candidatus Woesearchaeota archaeon]
MEIGLDLVKNENGIKINNLNEYKEINESKSQEELKKVAETIGLDLTKNLSKRIDII